MRILYVSHSFPLRGEPLSNVGGMQRVAVDLHRALAAHPEVDLYPLVLETSWRWTGLRTPPFLLRLLRAIPRLVRDREIDVVLFSSMVTAVVALPLRERIRRAGAVTAAIPVGRDVTLPNPVYQRLVPHVLRGLDHVFPISRATAAACLERGADPRRVHVVPCGTDLDRLAFASRAAARGELLDLLARAGHPVTAGSLLLLSVGRHQERKGLHWFTGAVMPRVGPGVTYVIAGTGPMTRVIEEAIEREGLRDRVVLLGRVPEETLRTLYRGADLFVMPNLPVPGDIEGFGVVLLEAGAAGLPVVAADLEGIRDVIRDGTNGRLLPAGDAAAFVAAIARYRNHSGPGFDRALLGEESDRAQAYVRECFGWPGIVERYLARLRQHPGVSAAAEASAGSR